MIERRKTKREVEFDEIKLAANNFFEFPTANKDHVSTTSMVLFVQDMLEKKRVELPVLSADDVEMDKQGNNYNYFEACFGREYTPIKYGLHSADHPAIIKELMGADTKNAMRDVVATLVWKRESDRQRIDSLLNELIKTKAELAAKNAETKCGCEACDMLANNGMRTRMSVCPECGDKRCDRAKFHRNDCVQAKVN